MSFHKQMSYLKSVVRIVGFLFLIVDFRLGVLLLVLAEAIGIAEEVEEK